MADALDEVVAGLSAGRLIPYVGAGAAALTPGGGPADPAALCAAIEAEVRPPKRAAGNLWAVAQFVESRRFRAKLEEIVQRAFAGAPGPNPLWDRLVALRPPMIVDAWYDGAAIAALRQAGVNWGWVQGTARQEQGSTDWWRAYDSAGQPCKGADPSWEVLLYKPHGLVAPGYSFLLSDSDYVEVLTEIDIQTPIPEAVQTLRTGRGFVFMGTRFDDQTLRIFARQIMKRSGGPHFALIEGALTRMEERFLEELGITRIDAPLAALLDRLSQPA
ncbi:SIR2-like protein [Phaeovulum vinaykumarii]|uniref:SIR2-like domain-containing protein n=2 Tax=Phaeovulum vinaykumarii TaxID=407234 RepID=A0A1N7JX51_9RHOB|nr:SIR2 family protein [Phaeovulum vinaykumarii]SIS53816.1 SIR2-like domain-containing protein [Phaeovulum vinaykumarii]SOB91720.1 SIR2-like protein [Phaeovulum vinaykumarii]